jgi:xanthine dehydrogenase YagR molybdenum-binding subunit
MVMGVGMAMLEATEYDQRSGGPINSSLADYLVAVNADCPQIDVTFLDFPDYNLIRSPPVALAKLGLSVWLRRSRTQSIMQPAIRVRKLPVRIEDLIVPIANIGT